MNVVHYVCVCTSRCTCVCAHLCVLDWEESKVFASRALAVVKKNMYLTNYSGYLAGFCESLSPPSLA